MLPILIYATEEEILFLQEEESYYESEIVEYLRTLRHKPLNINNATREELELLPWISPEEVIAIIEYRKQNTISNCHDLLKLGMNSSTIEQLQPYINFSHHSTLSLTQTTRLELHENKKALRSTLKYLQKTYINTNRYRFGFISQKDEEEVNLLDFYSWFGEYKSKHIIKHAVIGKYRLAFGQGILFASKLGASKSNATTTVPIKKLNPIKAYTSSYEIWALEGSTIQLALKNFELIPFYSQTKISANLDDNNRIIYFNQSGLHPNNENKDNINEKIYGTSLAYIFNNNKIGINYSQFNYNHNFAEPTLSSDYTAISLNFLLNKYITFGELASANNKLAGIIGSRWGEKKLRQLILIRYYQKDFPTWHGNPFSCQSYFDNEIGMYYGGTYLPFSQGKINYYFDIWNYPQTRYFEKMPTIGSEQFLQFEFKSGKHHFCVALQHKHKEKYISLNETKIRNFERTVLRSDWWQKLDNFQLKTRCELATEYLQDDKLYKKGILTYEQVKWKTSKLEITSQIAAYHSSVLLYMYENSIDGIMQNSILTGDGIYTYLILKYSISDNIDLQFKISDYWHQKDKMNLYLQIISDF